MVAIVTDRPAGRIGKSLLVWLGALGGRSPGRRRLAAGGEREERPQGRAAPGRARNRPRAAGLVDTVADDPEPEPAPDRGRVEAAAVVADQQRQALPGQADLDLD